MKAVLWLKQHTRVSATFHRTYRHWNLYLHLLNFPSSYYCTDKCQGSKLWSHLRRFRSELCLSGLQPLYFPRICRTILHTPLPLASLLPLQHTSRAAWIKFLEDASTASPSADPKDPAAWRTKCTPLTATHSPPWLAQRTLLCTPTTVVHPLTLERSASSVAHACASIHRGSSSQTSNHRYGLNCTIQWILIYSEWSNQDNYRILGQCHHLKKKKNYTHLPPPPPLRP